MDYNTIHRFTFCLERSFIAEMSVASFDIYSFKFTRKQISLVDEDVNVRQSMYISKMAVNERLSPEKFSACSSIRYVQS